jgi:thiamine biosynthesis protein ThiI
LRLQVRITDYDAIIVRFSGEIGIKSEGTRRSYEKQALRNINYVLRNSDLKPDAIERRRGRFYVKTPRTNEIVHALARVFGISSLSPAKQTTSDMEAVTETALVIAEKVIKPNTTFAVRCHRVGTHPYSSVDVCRHLGDRILTTLEPQSVTVSLKRPDTTVNVEIRDKEAYVYGDVIPGPGGFPLGTQGKTVCLLSGGIDSPVACWLTMKRGSPTIPIYVDNDPYTDESTKQKAIATARILKEWSTGYINKIYIIPNGENMKAIERNAPDRFRCLLCKRLMYRIAEHIAQAEKAYGIVTGEAIGEQASQTMHNLFAIDEAATRFPIHRPLLSFDKLETEAIAKRIGTFEVSIQKAKGCSAAPCKPATQARLSAVKEAEEKLDMSAMAEAAVAAALVLQL